ncbi:MAG: hypothetical protein EAZ53_09135 [Bacteroidetes bacterium]|nr:MAG: hypothetical protein EAZ53_09135 [Bacteroidota bacterium]
MEILPNNDSFFTQNRAFRYGDGIFETIIFENNSLNLWHYHIERLKKGIEILKFDCQNLLADLESQILNQIPDQSKNYRIRIQLWRTDGGLYTPLSNRTELFIEVTPFVKQTQIEQLETDFAKSISLSFSPLSALKTCNALLYILASIEKKERNLGEIILLSSDGFLAECAASNLFWMKENTLFTPSLSTGCIAGVMREHIINQAKKNNTKLEIGTWKPEILNSADLVFCSNVTGLRYLKMGNTSIDNSEIQKLLSMVDL